MEKIKSFITSTALAFGFLTVIPVNLKNKINEVEIQNSVIFYPVVGLFYGIILYLTYILFTFLKTGLDLTAFILLAIPYALNKFLHFDGLTDVADAFLADKSQKERLVIMKDSNVGSFALGFGVLFLILKFIVIKNFIEISGLTSLLILFPVFSRYTVIILSVTSEYPRKKGTASFIVGKISPENFLYSAIIFIFMIFIFFIFKINMIFYILILSIIAFLFVYIFRTYSYKKISGVTGDVLGAAIEITELILPLSALFCYKAFSL